MLFESSAEGACYRKMTARSCSPASKPATISVDSSRLSKPDDALFGNRAYYRAKVRFEPFVRQDEGLVVGEKDHLDRVLGASHDTE